MCLLSWTEIDISDTNLLNSKLILSIRLTICFKTNNIILKDKKNLFDTNNSLIEQLRNIFLISTEFCC